MTDEQKDLLIAIFEYFDNIADADWVEDRYRPNKEMRLAVELSQQFPFVNED